MCKILSRINEIATNEGITIPYLEQRIGASRGVISKAIKKGTDIQLKWLVRICDNFPQYSADWLLTGKGEMLRVDNATVEGKVEEPSEAPQASPVSKPISRQRQHMSLEELLNRGHQGRLAAKGIPGAIPLVSRKAVGGIIGEAFAISEEDIISYYVIPKFRYLNVDFLMELTGDSMAPCLCAGDIIACSIICNPSFIQWNKPHLVCTRDQGLIVKRLRRSSDDSCLMMVSDNPEYDPFDVPKSDILALARVVGSIHAE